MGEMKREVTVSRLVISALLQSHTVGTPLGRGLGCWRWNDSAVRGGAWAKAQRCKCARVHGSANRHHE